MVNTKAALQTFWKDRLTVTENREVTKSNKSTGFEEVIVLENEPCKLSYSTLQKTDQNDTNANLIQVIKLFLDVSIRIKPGSKITVYRHGEAFDFAQSGLAGLFSNHQEIVLIPFDKYA